MKFAIVNAWGCNRGSEAMQGAILSFLNSLDLNIKTTIYLHKWLDLGRYKNVEIKPWIALSDIYPNTPEQLRQLYLLGGIAWPQLLAPAVKDLIQHDLVVSSPEYPYFGEIYSEYENQYLLQLAICNSKGIPFGILANSTGPFLNATKNIIRRRVLNRSEFWTVREPISLENLSQLNLREDLQIHMGGDLALAHPKRSPEEFLDKGSLDEFEQLLRVLEREPFIMVVLTELKGFRRLDIGSATVSLTSYITKMGRLLQYVIDRTQHQVLICPHFYGKLTEQKLIREVIDCTERESKIKVLNPRYNVEAQMYLYGKATFTISFGTYHSIVFALKGECPFLSIRQQFKVDGLLKLFDNPGPVVTPVDSIEAWIEAFDEAWQNKNKIQGKIKKYLPEVVRGSQKHLDILGGWIKQSISQK